MGYLDSWRKNILEDGGRKEHDWSVKGTARRLVKRRRENSQEVMGRIM